MRTTLDIDDDVLQAAKEIAKADKRTAGEVITELARRSLTRPALNRPFTIRDGLPVLPRRGKVVTSELVKRLSEDEP